MIQLTDKTAQAFLKENYNRLVLLYFSAPWCGPCKVMGPQLEALDDAQLLVAGQPVHPIFVKVNVDDAPIFATTYDVRAVPTCILTYRNVMPRAVLAGARPKAALLSWLNESITRYLKGSLP